jgi:hypothetical protein
MLLLGFHYSSFLPIDIAIVIAIDILFTLIIQNQSPLPTAGVIPPGWLQSILWPLLKETPDHRQESLSCAACHHSRLKNIS